MWKTVKNSFLLVVFLFFYIKSPDFFCNMQNSNSVKINYEKRLPNYIFIIFSQYDYAKNIHN